MKSIEDLQFHPSVEHVLQFFKYEHLPEHLQAASRPFAELAQQIARSSSNAETTVALRKLLESKDAAVRAVLVNAACVLSDASSTRGETGIP